MADQALNELEIEFAEDEFRDSLKFVMENRVFPYAGAYEMEEGVTKNQTWFKEIKSSGNLNEYTNPYEEITGKKPDLLQRSMDFDFFEDHYDHTASELRAAIDITSKYPELFTRNTAAKMKAKFIAALTAACPIKTGGSESSETFDTASVESSGQVFNIAATDTDLAGRWDYAKVVKIMEYLGEAGWMKTGDELFFAIAYRDYSDIKKIAEFNSSQLLTSTSESMGFKDAFRWEGATWLVDNQADLGVSGNTQYNYCWLKSAMRGCMPLNPDIRIFDRSAETRSNQVYRSKLNIDFGFARAMSSASSNNLTRGVARIENDFS